MSGVYGPADDAESIATIRRALDLGVNFLDTSASYGNGHNHRLIGQAIRGRRHDVVIHSKSGSPRDGGPDAVRGGGDPRYLRQTCEQSLENLGIETLDVFCMSRVDPNVPIEESVDGMAELVTEGKTRFISFSECSAESLKRGSAVHPLVSLQMEYSAVLARCGRARPDRRLQGTWHGNDGLCRARTWDAERPRPRVEELAADDVRQRLPRFQSVNIEKNLGLRSALDAIAQEECYARPALHRVANGAGKACGGLHRPSNSLPRNASRGSGRIWKGGNSRNSKRR
jgi:hypothetical protein